MKSMLMPITVTRVVTICVIGTALSKIMWANGKTTSRSSQESASLATDESLKRYIVRLANCTSEGITIDQLFRNISAHSDLHYRVRHRFSKAINGVVTELSNKTVDFIKKTFPSVSISEDSKITLSSIERYREAEHDFRTTHSDSTNIVSSNRKQFKNSLRGSEKLKDNPSSNVQQVSGDLWNLDRLDSRERNFDGVYSYTNTGKGVNAYVLDTGVRHTHIEFGNRVRHSPNFSGDETPRDCSGHGTHVAGIIGGKTSGVAKDATLISVKVFPCSGETTTSGILLAIDWIISDQKKSNRPAVLNLSLGGLPNEPLEFGILEVRKAGILVVSAAGNSRCNSCNISPARMPGVVTVGATDSSDSVSAFSNLGPCVNIFAPGDNILSASSLSDFGGAFLTGTSMAVPHVVGIAAQYLESHNGASPEEVAASILCAGTPGVISTRSNLREKRTVNLFAFAKHIEGNTAAGPETCQAGIGTLCPGNPPCMGNGKCKMQGYCECFCGWKGPDCSSKAKSRTIGPSLTGRISLLAEESYFFMTTSWKVATFQLIFPSNTVKVLLNAQFGEDIGKIKFIQNGHPMSSSTSITSSVDKAPHLNISYDDWTSPDSFENACVELIRTEISKPTSHIVLTWNIALNQEANSTKELPKHEPSEPPTLDDLLADCFENRATSVAVSVRVTTIIIGIAIAILHMQKV